MLHLYSAAARRNVRCVTPYSRAEGAGRCPSTRTARHGPDGSMAVLHGAALAALSGRSGFLLGTCMPELDDLEVRIE